MTMARKKPARTLSFKQLVAKVQRAEDALEAQERNTVGELRQLGQTWREAWTPARIVIAGLAAGFVVGRAEPIRAIGKSGNLMQLVSMVSSLFAGGSAHVAAEEASETKEQVQADAGVAADAAHSAPADGIAQASDEEALALALAEARQRAARTATVDQVES
ncbi:MAG TPA: hypothetical protein VGD42_10640 [Lysobacter sp.]